MNAVLCTARAEDLNDIMEIVSQAKDFLRSQGVDQWQGDYPNPAVFQADIARGECYVLKADGRTAAVFTLILKDDPSYAKIDGAWLSEGAYAVLHRTAVAAGFRRAGLARFMLRHSEAICVANGIFSLRIDTHADNRPMRNMLVNNGFSYCGTIRLTGKTECGSSRVAYEKLLQKEPVSIAEK